MTPKLLVQEELVKEAKPNYIHRNNGPRHVGTPWRETSSVLDSDGSRSLWLPHKCSHFPISKFHIARYLFAKLKI